jgi:hypothetical protein
VTDPVAAAGQALGRALSDLGGLGGCDRSGVHRAGDGTATVVVKSYAAGSRESWARERGDLHALSPADACPDNNLLTAGGCRLIDFEWAEVRHPAWDATYLAVPWPTCWCSWRIPEASAARALDAYRERAVEGIPYVGTDAFLADVERARVCWALLSLSWSLANALRHESTPTPEGPSTRPRMQHRLQLVAESGTSAADVAGRVLEHTREQWGHLALALAPAYR